MEVIGFPQVAVAGLIFLVMLVSFGILSAVLDHHWSRYEIDMRWRRKARRIYYSTAGILLAFMFVTFILLII